MSDDDLGLSGWKAEWLQRTLPVFQTGATTISYVLALTTYALGIAAFIHAVRVKKELAKNPTNRAALVKKSERYTLKLSRGQFYVANCYIVCVLAIALVDGYIGATSLAEDASTHPEAWTASVVVEFIGFCGSLVAIFLAAFIGLPLLQMMVVTWVLARISRKHGDTTLARHIPIARAFSNFAALIWAMTCFNVTLLWPPLDESVWRWILLQGAYGSALAWLDASFAFNFRHESLAAKELSLTNGGVREIVSMFSTTVMAVHAKGAVGESLPKYEAVLQDDIALTLDQKKVLV